MEEFPRKYVPGTPVLQCSHNGITLKTAVAYLGVCPETPCENQDKSKDEDTVVQGTSCCFPVFSVWSTLCTVFEMRIDAGSDPESEVCSSPLCNLIVPQRLSVTLRCLFFPRLTDCCNGEMTSVGTWEPPGQDWPKTDISGSYPGRGSSIKERSDNTTLR